MEDCYYYVEYTNANNEVEYSVGEVLWEAMHNLREESRRAPVKFVEVDIGTVPECVQYIYGNNWRGDYKIDTILEDLDNIVIGEGLKQKFIEYVKKGLKGE